MPGGWNARPGRAACQCPIEHGCMGERRWRPSKPWDSGPITNGLGTRGRSTCCPRRCRSWPGSCGLWMAGARQHGGTRLDRPGRLRSPRRPALPDQRGLAGRCRRAAPVTTPVVRADIAVSRARAETRFSARSLRFNVSAQHLAVEVALNLIPLTLVLPGGDPGP